ncbi:MAG: carboxylate-amine ligase, partial [Acidobacteria bacterium]|nr:carboxylate-amine ligase [Acidobacteriota bacterium]
MNPPDPGSPEEIRRFRELQDRLGPLFQRIFPDPRTQRTVVVVPSLSLDTEELAKVTGAHHYEERLLCLLMLLRLPRTHVIYLSSQPISPQIIDYYLHLLPGIPGQHARQRLRLMSCHDAAPVPLTRKILERPRMITRIREAIPDLSTAHMVCFTATPLERTLAVRLGLPLYGADPDLAHLGTKSGSRKIFREAGVQIPDGFEELRDVEDIFGAVTELKGRNPELKKVVVKLNEGFSGEGNAVFPLEDCPEGTTATAAWVRRELPERLRFEARGETWERFSQKFRSMRGVVESWVSGAEKRSPSVQCRIDPANGPMVISTHDQVLGGPSGQIFLGCRFPADDEYRLQIHEAGQRIAQVLGQYRALGRFGVDFVSVREPEGWKHYAIEINLRKGGTTHPFIMLQFLIDGTYDRATGLYRTRSGQPRFYYASDNVESESYRGFTPEDLTDISVFHRL